MKSRIKTVFKIVALASLSLLWFIFIQVEYEMVTKPHLQNEFPGIKGVGAVYFLGVALLVISGIIFILLRPVLNKLLKKLL